MINMRTVMKRVVNNHKHKKCKTRTKKIKITIIRRIIDNCSQEGGSLKGLSFKRFNSKAVVITS